MINIKPNVTLQYRERLEQLDIAAVLRQFRWFRYLGYNISCRVVSTVWSMCQHDAEDSVSDNSPMPT
jgi:hypothetical protein